jgi:tape measure domain-containing protein
VSVVANVAVNLDARGVTAQLAAIRQGSIGAADGFKNLQARAQAVKSIVEAQQGSFAKASTVQGVFAAKVKNTEFAIKAQIAALRDVQSKVQFNGALYQKAAAQIAQYEATLAKATATQDRSQKSSGSLLGSIGRLASAYLSLRVAQQAVQAGIKREESERRLTFLAQGYNEVARAQTLASQSGKRFGLSATESNQQFAQLYGRLRPLNISLKDINAAFVGFNTAAKVSGTSTAETAGALLQLTQALGSGVLRGQELNSVLEQAPGLVVALTKQLGVPVSTLRKLAEEGKITSDVVINALKRAGIEGAGQLEAALKGPAQSVKNLQNSFEDFQISLTNDVIPAVVELLKVTTSILGAFNKLPGPVKTITAVVFGLVAAFVALAPAISATIGLLGGLSLATLAAAGPWIALAAGVTAAAVALAGYRTESQKIGAKAAAGDPAAMAAARGRMVTLGQEISLMKLEGAEKASPRSALGGSFANAKAEFAQLKRDVKTGQTAAATPATAMGTPVGATVGDGSSSKKRKGKSDEERAAEKAAQAEQQIQERLRGLTREIELNAQISTIKELQFQAEMDGNKELQARLQGEERIIQIMQSTAQSLDGITDQRLQQKILAKAEGEIASARQETALEMQRIDNERTKSFNEIIAGLNLELALKTATTEQAREQLRLEAEIAKLPGQGFTPEQIGAIAAKKTELAAPKTDQQNITEKIGTLKDEIADLTSISNIAITSAEGIGNAFAQSFQGLISGTMTAKEALGSFFKSVADMFLEMAAQIIAKQITMIILQTILKALGAVGGIQSAGSSAGSAAFGGSGPTFNPGAFSMPQLAGRAVGGPVTGQQPYMVGERGPELFVPGTGGSVVSNGDLRSAMNGGSGGGSGSPVLNMSFQSTSINGVEYVSREQLESAMAETRRNATRDGAKRGMTMTLDRIQNSSSTRRKVGI